MKVQSSVLVPLGFGKYVRSDRITALVPIEEDRGSGRRTYVYLEDENTPLVASHSEATILRDIVREPKEITQSRQQQEILEDLLTSLSHDERVPLRLAPTRGRSSNQRYYSSHQPRRRWFRSRSFRTAYSSGSGNRRLIDRKIF